MTVAEKRDLGLRAMMPAVHRAISGKATPRACPPPIRFTMYGVCRAKNSSSTPQARPPCFARRSTAAATTSTHRHSSWTIFDATCRSVSGTSSRYRNHCPGVVITIISLAIGSSASAASSPHWWNWKRLVRASSFWSRGSQSQPQCAWIHVAA
ncbi:MAG: hypothetical protein ACYSUF_12510 [Planctomycetota bacterium]